LGRGSIQGEEVILVKPETYMNRSGLAVSSLLRYTTATPADLILVFDDLDLAPGVLRVRQKGSAGGHRGMISVIQSVGTDELLRIRIGIGRPLHSWEVTQYVLSPFSREEKEVVDSALVRALRALEEIVAGNITAVMNEYNR
jgi:PTH1 family peptidyl-tRNA hydrolase